MNLKLKIWRKKDANDKGSMVDYEIQNVSEHMSFLEMLDVLNEELVEKLSLLLLIMIVEKEFTVCAHFT